MPSHLDTARSGLRARRVRSALKAPMFPIPAPSAPKLISDIYNRQSRDRCNDVVNVIFHKTLATGDSACNQLFLLIP